LNVFDPGNKYFDVNENDFLKYLENFDDLCGHDPDEASVYEAEQSRMWRKAKKMNSGEYTNI
jgi:hypothetical protein